MKKSKRYYFEIDGDRKEAFTAKGKRRVSLGDGMVLVNATVKIADGTRFDAVLEIDKQSSGEHCGTYFLLPDEIVRQGDPDLCEKLGKTKDEIFPYRYKYRVPLHCDDIHVGEDGWS